MEHGSETNLAGVSGWPESPADLVGSLSVDVVLLWTRNFLIIIINLSLQLLLDITALSLSAAQRHYAIEVIQLYSLKLRLLRDA